MSHDPYSPCVCGSGKKLKFCCQDILTEMIRVEKLVDTQPEAAEKLLRSLQKKHADKEVLATQLSAVLMRQGRYSEAREELVSFLKRQPDEPRALLALADICIVTDGFWSSRRIVHRAFQLGARQYPNSVAMLAGRIANQMAQAGCAMAVREHLALAVRMSDGERRNSMLLQLANYESQRNIPYPYRGRFSLLPVNLEDGLQRTEEQRARKVSQIGCWEPAAILYARLVEQAPNNGELWHNLGLFRAWDGQIEGAAIALHKAAELLTDHDTAVETEALAQLLDQDLSKDSYGVVQHTISVESVSQLLTQLDEDDRFARVRNTETEPPFEGGRVAAEYELLSQPLSEDDTLPDVVGDITVVDVDESAEAGPQVLVVALDSDIDSAKDAFLSVAGELAEVDEDAEPSQLSRLPANCRLFDWKIHHSDELGSSHYRELDQKRLSDALESWVSTPLASLNDQSPEECAKDSENHVRVAASLLVLNVTCNRMGYDPDLSEIHTRLGLPAIQPLETAENLSVTALPLLRFGRLDVGSLTDKQIIEFTNRITLVRHQLLLETVVEELVSREEAMKEFGAMRAYLLRATVAREKNDFKLASESFDAAREAVENEPDAFRTKLELDIRELSCRLDHPQDPELPTLLGSIRDRYFVKIPEIEEVIREELENSGCQHLLSVIETAGAGSTSESLWTPGETAEPEGESKLWLPGQD